MFFPLPPHEGWNIPYFRYRSFLYILPSIPFIFYLQFFLLIETVHPFMIIIIIITIAIHLDNSPKHQYMEMSDSFNMKSFSILFSLHNILVSYL